MYAADDRTMTALRGRGKGRDSAASRPGATLVPLSRDHLGAPMDAMRGHSWVLCIQARPPTSAGDLLVAQDPLGLGLGVGLSPRDSTGLEHQGSPARLTDLDRARANGSRCCC